MWDYVDGDGLWKRYRNTVTGEQSIKEHELKIAKTWCATHRFSSDIPRNRIISCLDCGQEIRFVVGYHDLVDGKLVLRKPRKT